MPELKNLKNLKTLLEKNYVNERAGLVRRLRARFTALDEAECEDVVQFAFVQAWTTLSKSPTSDADFALQQAEWGPWLWRVSFNAAIDYLRRVEAWSLEALTSRAADSDDLEVDARPISDSRARTPSQILAAEERAAERRMLVSDLLRNYVAHVEKYRSWRQCEVFERSLRGQRLVDMADEMRVPLQRLYEIRSAAFGWFREQIEKHDGRGSILESAFRVATTVRDESEQAGPRRIVDLVRWAVDQVGALCPSPKRLAAAGPDIQYHVRAARWYLLAPTSPTEPPGCPQCRHDIADPPGGHSQLHERE